jgi:hypothetical protein
MAPVGIAPSLEASSWKLWLSCTGPFRLVVVVCTPLLRLPSLCFVHLVRIA